MAGIAAVPALPAMQAGNADAALAALGEQFAVVVKLFGESRWEDKTLLARLTAIGTAIVDTPAITVADLIVKARIAAFLLDTGIWHFIDSEPGPGDPGIRFAISVVADLVRQDASPLTAEGLWPPD